ncbi:hypothetical protein FAZ15_14425 [Sphingobacterium olei]|uniref:YolD-like family protein n=1 Tax=Sphingobacterium olei TaxID=2571155 RepID=A0A4U0NZ23_9SPHI|nr:hypothetical protein [Sphingobacterium olei]TJZ60075.1 hypothetical protein FAZ15_14425 [Sphingobacterium olei]
METKFKEIDKENIGKLNFPMDDIVKMEKKQIQRQSELERAMALGNLEQVKVKIYFEDDKDKLFVETTIWGVTDESVILKQGLVIPNRRIFKVI